LDVGVSMTFPIIQNFAVQALKITGLHLAQELTEEELEIVVHDMNNLLKARDKNASTVQSYS
jgi:hypothetical protein